MELEIKNNAYTTTVTSSDVLSADLKPRKFNHIVFIDMIEDRFDIKISHQTRSDIVKIPRHMVSYFIMKSEAMTSTALSKILGFRTHTSVLHSQKLISKMIETKDKKYMEYFEIIEGIYHKCNGN